MKFSTETFITVLITLLVFKVLDRMFLDKALGSLGMYEENYDNE